MGWGDEVMATARARRIYERTGNKVMIVDRKGTRRTHEAWLNNPIINCFEAPTGCELLQDCGGHRPYVDVTPEFFRWKVWNPEPGELYLTPLEVTFANRNRGLVIVEPNLKPRASPNKDWGWSRWLAFAEVCRVNRVQLTQLGPQGTRMLPGARHLQTANMRLASAALSQCSAFVGHEGGLHHTAAAFQRPAVVIFGGFISPVQTGYKFHRNLFTGGTPCGTRSRCDHCAQAMAAIQPQEVYHHLERILR